MKVGFIGLGLMGSSMALNLRKAGFAVTVSDLRRDAATAHLAAGCAWADDAKKTAEASDIVFTSLPGPKEVEAVALAPNGLLAGMKKGMAYFDLSTNSPTVVRRLHEVFAKEGRVLLDSPVSGGPSGAKSGKLALWVVAIALHSMRTRRCSTPLAIRLPTSGPSARDRWLSSYTTWRAMRYKPPSRKSFRWV